MSTLTNLPTPMSGAVDVALTPYASNPIQTAAAAADTVLKWSADGSAHPSHIAMQNNSAVDFYYAFDQDSTQTAAKAYKLAAGNFFAWDRSFSTLHCHTASQVSFGGDTGITVEAFA